MKIFSSWVKKIDNVFCHTQCILRKKTLLLFFISSAFVSADGDYHSYAELSLTEELRSLDESDLSSFGIRNKCIRRNAIRSIRFQDDQIAIINVGRGKEIVLSLRRPCVGIKRTSRN